MKYIVNVYETQSGAIIIDATSQGQAEDIAKNILDEQGIVGFDNFDVKHREADIV